MDATGAQRLAYVAPVGVGKADVEHEDVRGILAEAAHRFGAQRRCPHGEPLVLKCVAHYAAQDVVVLADAGREDARHNSRVCMLYLTAT